jgi:hypothetical protein
VTRMDEDHFLASFLEEKLPALGLDAETYGPYLLGLLPMEEAALLDDGGRTEGADDDEWHGVLELLQASSESHSDDMEAWQALKRDLLKRYQELLADARERKAEADARLLGAAKLVVASISDTKKEDKSEKKSSAIDEEAKRVMIARYAYEGDEDSEEEEGGDSGNVNANKQAAKQATIEGTKDVRKQNVQTKKDEQQKSKQAKQDKIKLKEERRKRATKGERKR